ncbi:MAG TPA: DegT/DnrJ/EryC1/StrS family aminotransferase [Candidatus Eisenbacteria bacterium]|nr:DegT/DnrJ/EryC1/StrS family aminotransferase [Candidatus Eisenbacteria bacterium]
MSGSEIPLVDLRAQHRSIAAEVEPAVRAVMERADFVLGHDVEAFEAEYADYCEVGHAVGLDSGLSALELGMRALGIGPGDEVITPANSFIASSSAISATGATPVWADVDPRTCNLDPDAVRAVITPRTRAIMPVHLYGQPADMDAIAAIAREHGLKVIEDACQAHGARVAGRRVGSMGDFAAFSFYPAKNLGAYGDGGILTTRDAELADRVRMMRNYGQRQKYEHVTTAWNRRLDTIQAAVLRIKLRRLDEWNAARRRHAALYDRLLRDSELELPWTRPDVEHVYHLYVVQTDGRDQVLAALRAQGIGAALHYPVPIHLQETYRDRGCGRGAFPVTERAAGRLLSLPMYPELTEEQVHRVANAVTSAVAGVGGLRTGS